MTREDEARETRITMEIVVDAYTGYRGVPPQRWSAVDAEWQRRATADPALGEWATFDLKRRGA